MEIGGNLEIPHRVSPAVADIAAYIHDKCYCQVNKYRRPETKKSYVDKKHTNPAGCNSHSVS